MSTLKQRFAMLKDLRPDVSQADLARATGAKPPSVNAWFTGETKSMKGATAAKVAALYGVSPLWLAEGVGEMLASADNQVMPAMTAPRGTLPTLAQALEVLATSLNQLPDDRRELAAQHLQTLARAPDSKKAMAALLQVLTQSAKAKTSTFDQLMGMEAKVESADLPRPTIEK